MIAVTHPGKIGDMAFILPICSWLYKTKGEKIVFVLPKWTPFLPKIGSLLRAQEFTQEVYLCDFLIKNWDKGGQPYKFDPRGETIHLLSDEGELTEVENNLEISEYYNFGFRDSPDKFATDFYAEEYGLGIDKDFKLNLNIEGKEKTNEVIYSEVLEKFLYPGATTLDFSKDFLWNLQRLALAKEVHLHCSSLAAYLGYTDTPIVLHSVFRIQPQINLLESVDFNTSEVEHMKIWMRNHGQQMNLKDLVTYDQDNNLKSIYKEVCYGAE